MQTQTWKLRTTRFVFRVMGAVAPRIAAERAYTMFSTPRSTRTSTRDQHVMDAAEKLRSTFTNKSLTGYAWGEGPSILLVHGWEGAARNFTTLVMPLVEAGFRVVAFDAPAHGDSDGYSSNLFEYSSALAALTTEFGPIYGIIAHSMGAAATIFMMGTMKHYRINRLVLVGAPCELTDVMARFAGEINLTTRSLSLMYRLTYERLGIPASAVSIKAMIPYISTPGLLIHDRRDSVIPFGDAVTIAEHWPSGELVTTDGLGHYKTLRDSATVERIVRFMADVRPDECYVD